MPAAVYRCMPAAARFRCRAEDSAISAEGKGRITAADLRNPFVLLATGLGSGLAPAAPGTVGSLLALPIWWFLIADLPLLYQLAFVVVVTLLSSGWWIARVELLASATHRRSCSTNSSDSGWHW